MLDHFQLVRNQLDPSGSIGLKEKLMAHWLDTRQGYLPKDSHKIMVLTSLKLFFR